MNNDDLERRQITSAIDNVSVAGVRRCLSLLRKMWEDSQEDCNHRPFYFTDECPIEGMSFQDFAFCLLRGQNTKRVNKKLGVESKDIKNEEPRCSAG